MAREFKNFKPNNQSKSNIKKDNIEDVINQYQNKSENELMDEIVNKYSSGLSEGTISAKELDKFIDNARNYLTAEQLNKLNMIVSKLKNI